MVAILDIKVHYLDILRLILLKVCECGLDLLSDHEQHNVSFKQ